MAAKKELLLTIEVQREKISKYEKKLTDLIHAYKSLLKEKDALQTSLSALADAKVYPRDDDSKTEGDESTSEQVEESDSESTYSGLETDTQEVLALRGRIMTLKTSLKTLSTERIKAELSLKEDRKQILDDKRKLEDRLKEESASKLKLQKESDEKVQELRTKVLVSHHEREQESNNTVFMLRELESKLTKERKEKERLENQFEESKEQNRHLGQAVASRNQEKHQKQINDLQNELEQVRSRLQRAEEQVQEPPILKELQTQMLEMRVQYTEAIRQEQRRAESAESSARTLSQVHEERVAALETCLTELSLSAANDNRARQTQLQTIHSLKERLSELTEENVELVSRAYADKINDQTEADYNSVVKSFVHLWDKLQKSKKSMDVEGLLIDSEIIHKSCRDQIKNLDEEIEKLKMNSEKQKQKETKCTCGLKEQLEEVKERVRSLTSAGQLTQITHSQQVASLIQGSSELKEKHEKAVKQMVQDHKVAVMGLEQQLGGHCQRSLLTLQDRDEEIQRLNQEIHRLNKEAAEQPTTVAAALLSQVSLGGSEGPLLHHVEEMARKDIEITELRRDKRIFERDIRDIQRTSIERQQAMQDTIDDLQEEVARLMRNTSRRGENLEYLKNVVLQYMTSTEAESRYRILKAISAILKFTPAELARVKGFLALWWWQTPVKPSPPAPKYDQRRASLSPRSNSTASDSK